MRPHGKIGSDTNINKEKIESEVMQLITPMIHKHTALNCDDARIK